MVRKKPPQILASFPNYEGRKWYIHYDKDIKASISEACTHIQNHKKKVVQLKKRTENYADGIPLNYKQFIAYGELVDGVKWGRVRSDELRLYLYWTKGTLWVTHCRYKTETQLDDNEIEICKRHYNDNKEAHTN